MELIRPSTPSPSKSPPARVSFLAGAGGRTKRPQCPCGAGWNGMLHAPFVELRRPPPTAPLAAVAGKEARPTERELLLLVLIWRGGPWAALGLRTLLINKRDMRAEP